MAVRSRRLGMVSVAIAAVEALVFIVPTNRTAIIKHLAIAANGDVGGQVTVFIKPSATANARVVWQGTITGRTAFAHSGAFLVLHEGESLVVTNGGQAALHVSAHGALLDGDPS